MNFWTGAILGAIGGVVGLIFVYFRREQKFNKVLRSIKDPGLEYAVLYNYASYKRYKHGTKYYDSTGILYLIGSTLYYKSGENESPVSFNLEECSVQAEPDWRLLKWFSVITPAGEKYYFNSNKMGLVKANSDETLKGLSTIKAKIASLH